MIVQKRRWKIKNSDNSFQITKTNESFFLQSSYMIYFMIVSHEIDLFTQWKPALENLLSTQFPTSDYLDLFVQIKLHTIYSDIPVDAFHPRYPEIPEMRYPSVWNLRRTFPPHVRLRRQKVIYNKSYFRCRKGENETIGKEVAVERAISIVNIHFSLKRLHKVW